MKRELLLYNLNCKRSKELCKQMEELQEELSRTGDVLKPELHHHLYMELQTVREVLNEVWTEQVKLYDKAHKKPLLFQE